MRRKIVMTMLIGLALGLMGPAAAAPPDASGVVERAPHFETFFYRGDGVIVLTGPEFEQGCVEEGLALPTATYRSPGNGSSIEHVNYIDSAMVFEDTAGPAPDDIFPWLDAQCAAALDGDPGTAPQEPIATGDVRVAFHLRLDPSGVVHVQNGVTGTVTTSDGDRVHVNTYAKYTADASGLELQILRVNYGG